jgi:hypothetical protein
VYSKNLRDFTSDIANAKYEIDNPNLRFAHASAKADAYNLVDRA